MSVEFYKLKDVFFVTIILHFDFFIVIEKYYWYNLGIIKYEGGIIMLKLLAKIAEKYAKSTNTACFFFGVLHQPKMPASLIKRD